MPAPDKWASYDPGLTGRLTRFEVVTPNDSADITFCPRAVYFNASGNVAFWPKGSITPITLAVTAGTREPWGIDRILATGTTVAAGSIVIAD